MQLIAYHLLGWSETCTEWEPLSCPARELPLVTCSLCCLLIHLGVQGRFLQMPIRGVKELLCALAGGPALQNFQPELSHLLQGWQHQAELSGGVMNFFSCKLMALQQPSKSAFLHSSAPLLFASCTYFWSWQQNYVTSKTIKNLPNLLTFPFTCML